VGIEPLNLSNPIAEEGGDGEVKCVIIKRCKPFCDRPKSTENGSKDTLRISNSSGTRMQTS